MQQEEDGVDKRIGVGIIGLNPERGWGLWAHVPAIRALPDRFELVALCTSRQETARTAAQQLGVPHWFADPVQMASHSQVDLVVVAVKVPQHQVLVNAALQAGKAVYCEWPLARDVAEAAAIQAATSDRGVRSFIGLQLRHAPAIRYLRDLIAEGYVGKVRSSSVIASGFVWGPVIDEGNAYAVDASVAATMIRVPFGHFADAMTLCLGDFSQVFASTANHYDRVLVLQTQKTIPKTAPDQLLVQGRLQNDAVVSIHYRGGISKATNLHWEINGTEGDLLLTSDMGQMQMAELRLQGARHPDGTLSPLPVPERYLQPGMPGGYGAYVPYVYDAIAKAISGEGSPPADHLGTVAKAAGRDDHSARSQFLATR